MVAARTLGIARTREHGQPGEQGSAARKRMRELSMLVHPDKCSLPGAEQVCLDPLSRKGQEEGGI